MLTKETTDNLAKVTSEFIQNFDYKCADGREMSSIELVQEKKRCQKKIDRQIAKAKKKGVSAEQINELSVKYEVANIFNLKSKGRCSIRDLKKSVRAAIKAAK